MPRSDGRKANELRPLKIQRNFLKHAEGAVLIAMGETKVICTASVEEKVPPFLRGSGTGWITAEYAMLPRSTNTRTTRDAVRGHVGGRNQEIQRLIGRSLRSAVDLRVLKERSILIDCDVIQADGGTRTASISGAFVALVDALWHLHRNQALKEWPLRSFLAAVSVGIVDGKPLLDLTYEEDSSAQVDMNLVMTEKGELVEVQSTAEKAPFTRTELAALLSLGEKGILQIVKAQKEALKDLLKRVHPTG